MVDTFNVGDTVEISPEELQRRKQGPRGWSWDGDKYKGYRGRVTAKKLVRRYAVEWEKDGEWDGGHIYRADEIRKKEEGGGGKRKKHKKRKKISKKRSSRKRTSRKSRRRRRR